MEKPEQRPIIKRSNAHDMFASFLEGDDLGLRVWGIWLYEKRATHQFKPSHLKQDSQKVHPFSPQNVPTPYALNPKPEPNQRGRVSVSSEDVKGLVLDRFSPPQPILFQGLAAFG